LTTQDDILSMPATISLKPQMATYVKISPVNFQNNTSLNLSYNYIAEAVEYAINPYQINNTYNIATNLLEVNLYNYNTSLQNTYIEKAVISNLTTVPIEFFFAVNDNQNLTEFA
jgi:hypothetical protein